MAVALLILGATRPEILRRALPFYTTPYFKVFIHIDRKENLESYASRLGQLSGFCSFLEARRPIYWGGFNMVAASLDLVREAMESPDITNLCLISDDTFPLLPPKELHQLLSAEVQRISSNKLEPDHPFQSRYDGVYALDHMATSMRERLLEESVIDQAFFDMVAGAQSIASSGKAPIPIFHGSQWWSLTRHAAEVALHSYDTDALITESFRFSAVPDEMYLQSVFARKGLLASAKPSPMLVDWTRYPKPYVFTEVDDVDRLTMPWHGFVRKLAGDNMSLIEALVRRFAGNIVS